MLGIIVALCDFGVDAIRQEIPPPSLPHHYVRRQGRRRDDMCLRSSLCWFGSEGGRLYSDGQRHNEGRAFSLFALNHQCPAMSLCDDIVTQAQTQSCSTARRLRRKKGFKNLLVQIPRNARAIVAHTNFDGIFPPLRLHANGWLTLFGDGIEGIAE